MKTKQRTSAAALLRPLGFWDAVARGDKMDYLKARCLTIQCRRHSGPESLAPWVVLESSMPIATGDTVRSAMDAASDPLEIGGSE